MAEDTLGLTVRFIAEGAIELQQVAIGDGHPMILLHPTVDNDGEVEIAMTVGGGLDRSGVATILVTAALMLDQSTVEELMAESLDEAGLTLTERSG